MALKMHMQLVVHLSRCPETQKFVCGVTTFAVNVIAEPDYPGEQPRQDSQDRTAGRDC